MALGDQSKHQNAVPELDFISPRIYSTFSLDKKVMTGLELVGVTLRQLDIGSGGWLAGCPKFTSRTIKYSASAISIAAPSVNANIFMTPLSFSV